MESDIWEILIKEESVPKIKALMARKRQKIIDEDLDVNFDEVGCQEDIAIESLLSALVRARACETSSSKIAVISIKSAITALMVGSDEI